MYHAPPHTYRHSRPPGQAPLPAHLTVNTQTAQAREFSTFAMASGSDQTPANSASISINNANSAPPPPPSPSIPGEVNDSGNYDIPGPPPVSRVWDGKIWKIEVRQHPLRARMCGFGDKDRRPISPPPCVLLRIFDARTTLEIDYTKVADLSKLVLMVDLWNLHGSREDNCVKHTTSSPSISSTNVTNYPHVFTGRDPPNPAHDYIPSNMATYGAQTFTSPTTSAPNSAPNSAASYYPSNGHHAYANGGSTYDQRTTYPSYSQANYNPQYQNGYELSQNSHSSPRGSMSSSSNQPLSARSSQDMGIASNSGVRDARETTIARNLIGSSSAGANLLQDQHGQYGIWFVLQDLSVRTEGWFRLKLNLFNLAQLTFLEEGNRQPLASGELLNEAPCLASAFSKPFKVFSAKKFPGVIESTDLSKSFAGQGVKIPVRKDGAHKKRKAGFIGDDDGVGNGEQNGGGNGEHDGGGNEEYDGVGNGDHDAMGVMGSL